MKLYHSEIPYPFSQTSIPKPEEKKIETRSASSPAPEKKQEQNGIHTLLLLLAAMDYF